MFSIVWPGDPAPSQDYGWTDLAVEPVWQGRHFHCGIDIPLNVGTPLQAARGGTVVYVGWGLLAIKATETQTDWYVHIDSSRVGMGAPIDRGNLIAHSGARVPAGGSLTGPHLHFEVQDAAYNNPALGIFSRLNLPATSVDPVPILTEAFTAAAQALGGLDMATADQILAAVTMPLPPQPPGLAQYNYQPSDLQTIVSTRTWDSIKASYGADGEAWLYQYSHPVTIAAAVAAMQVEQAAMKAEVDALKSGQPADLSAVMAAQVAVKASIDAIKAEEDALKAQADATKADVDAVKQKTDRDLV